MKAIPFVSSVLGPEQRVILGEGPIFFRGRLLTTDARRSLIRSSDLESGETENIDLAQLLRDQGLIADSAPNPILGSIARAEDGRLLAAMATGIYLFDFDSGSMTEFSHPEKARIECGPHYNDGKVGPDGAFYVGGMIGGQEGAGRLLRIAGDGSFTEALTGAPPLTTPNGMHWMATAEPHVWDFYYVCSQYPAIQHYRHDTTSGIIDRRPDLIQLPRSTFGFLDGMTGTHNGLLILALYLPNEYGCIVVDTRTGEIIERIVTDAPQTTSVAMHGDRAYITSAAQEYTEQDYAEYPRAGAIFRCSMDFAEHPLLREAREAVPQSSWDFSFGSR